MKKRFQTLFIAITMSVTGCGRPLNPNYIDEYNHQYDDLKVSEVEAKYSEYTYKDIDKNHFYTSLGYPFSFSPSIGNVNYIVVPVWFTDSTDFISLESRDNVREDIEKAYFGTEEDTGWESVSTFYKKDSFGKLNIGGVVTDWFECGRPSSYFYESTGSADQTVYDVYNWILENNIISDLTIYDADKDGFLDGLVLVYAYHNKSTLYRETGKWIDSDNLWAYTYWTLDRRFKNVDRPGPDTFFWSSYDFMYGDSYKTQTRTGKSKYGAGDTSHLKLDSHTFIHETGHMLGLPDYYDYSGIHSYSLGFSMQDYNVGGHDPYSRFSLGWAKAIVPTETVKVNLPLMEESGTFILLSPHYQNSAFDEYIILELYSPTGLNSFDSTYQYFGGYPKGPNKVGIRLWHVDSRLVDVIKYSSNTLKYKEYNIVAAPTDGMVIDYATNNSTYVKGQYGNRSVKYAGKHEYVQLQGLRRNYMLLDLNGELIDEDDFRQETLMESDLFIEGDYFSLHNYREQFVEENYLNSLEKLGWDFYIDKITDKNATITLIKK